MLKAIVFDFDGVLVDSEPLHYRAFLRVAERLGIHFSYEQYLDEYVGFDDRDAFRHMLRLNAATASQADDPAAIAKLCHDKGEAFIAVVEQGVEPIPGMLKFVEAVAAQWPIAIASGATRQDIDVILGKLELAQRFCPIVTADDVAHSKPDPASYRLAVERLAQQHPELNLTVGNCLAIEDTAAGLQSARAAGLWTLGLTTTAPAEHLHQAHRVIASIEGVDVQQLREWFD